jgi:hypothetical protein
VRRSKDLASLALRVDALPPESERVRSRVDDLDVGLGEERVGVDEVAHEELERVIVVPRIHGLGEVDDRDRSLPEEHVVGRQVGVHAVMGEEEVHVLEDPRVDAVSLLPVQLDADEDGRRGLDVAEVLHQDHRPHALDGEWDIRADCVEHLERLHLVADPGAELVRPPVLRLLAEDAGVGTSASRSALLIDGVPLETSHFQRAIDLGRDEVSIERWVRVAAVDHGLLAALDRSNHVEQQVLLDQRSEVLEQLLFDGFLLRLRGFWQRVLARRATIGLDILVEANETSLRRMPESEASTRSTASELEYTRGKGERADGVRRGWIHGR